MGAKVGKLIKEARTNADLTQEKLARKISGLSAGDISRAERGELDLTQAQLKAIAKALGITQASLLNAAKEEKEKTTSKKSTSSTSSSSSSTLKLTATEKKLVEYYRKADSKTKQAAMDLLKGEKQGFLNDLLGSDAGSGIADVLGDVLGGLFK